jgi:aspartyl-tRNA(Asn)/glutamyl-tRNA(Gln) amidotransferase subunit C
MSVTSDDVRHVARLARVGLDDARVPSLVAELNGILAHMDVLQQVDVSGVPAAPPDSAAPWRDDSLPADGLTRAREAFAPSTRDGFFLVPRLATHGALGASAEDDDA